MAQVFRKRERPSRAMGAPTGTMTVGGSSGTQLSSRADRAADAALLAGYGLGDPSAATAFVRRFQGSVFGLALSVTRERTLAEDVAQEAFLRAWKAATTYDAGRASVSTWLLTITRNAAIDAVRARRSTPVSPQLLEQVVQESFSASDTPDTAVHRIDSVRALKQLAELSPSQARAVALVVLGGCTAAEVGEHEDIPLGTAKTRIRLGLMRLRVAMRVPATQP
ncbi:MAG TPA: RNA polymerase sigma factor [Nocardioidaceae bacterium]|nr:RNA polymerase sigma factor [Nocardioidaceae bacterium]